MDNRNNKRNGATPKKAAPSQAAQLKSQLMREIRRELSTKAPNRVPLSLSNSARSRRSSVSGGNFNPQFPKGESSATIRTSKRYAEDEYVAEVNGSTSTTVPVVTTYAFNPGQASLFPIGSIEASKWSEWRLIKATPYYRPSVSAFATNGQSGKLILAFDYNARNGAPTTKQMLETMVPHGDCLPCESTAIALDAGRINRSDAKYVRVGVQPNNTDIRTMDGGNLHVATIGNQSTGVIGELRIKYEFELFIQSTTGTSNTNTNSAWFQSATAGETLTSTVALPLALGSTTIINNISAVNTAGSIALPAGNYQFDAQSVAVYSGGAGSIHKLDVKRNGVSLFQDVANVPTLAVSHTTSTMTALVYASILSTDAITLVDTSTFASTAKAWGSLRITAV